MPHGIKVILLSNKIIFCLKTHYLWKSFLSYYENMENDFIFKTYLVAYKICLIYRNKNMLVYILYRIYFLMENYAMVVSSSRSFSFMASISRKILHGCSSFSLRNKGYATEDLPGNYFSLSITTDEFFAKSS